MAKRTCRVEVQRDYIEKITNASPERALAELIWNALDADATEVSVFFVPSAVGGVEEIVIKDNGVGFSVNDAESYFTSLGGSWKASQQRTLAGREIHGKEGQGRFKGFSLGRSIEWSVVQDKSEKPFKISAVADSLEEFRLEESPDSLGQEKGVTVRITELDKQYSIFDPDVAVEKLIPIFALYLRTYSNARVFIDGVPLDPATSIKSSTVIPLEAITYKDVDYNLTVEIVEWNKINERELWLCSATGFPEDRYTKQIRGIGEFGFTGYLKSELISALKNDGVLGLSDLNDSIRLAADNAVDRIKEHFAERLLEENSATIEKWKTEEVYPYTGEAASPVAMAERQVFNAVATKVAENLPSFDDGDKKTKAFQLRMLRSAVERGPEELQGVITEVLNLPQKQLDQLSSLLRDVSLAGVISASKMVTDRLKFISGLELLLFDPDSKKTLKERSQLHKIVAENTWIFGQEFSVSVNDQSLTQVLRKHRSLLGGDVMVDEAVKRIDGKTGIVDLMLSRSIPGNREDEVEHLIVELKAPKVKVGDDECTQIKRYAYAVIKDERFSELTARWNFWVVSNELDSFTEIEANQQNRQRGVISHSRKENREVTVWVKTWSQLIAENKHRLEFVRRNLEYEIDQNEALQHLRDNYSQFTEGVVVEGEELSPAS